MRKRGQSSVEFTFLISFMFLVFVVFFYVAGSRFASIKGDNEKLLLEDFGDYLKAEISLAASAADGYQRSFEIPSQLGGREYNVSIIPNKTDHPFSEMAVSYYSSSIDYSYVMRLPLQTIGSLYVGSTDVLIEKRNNMIYFNSGKCQEGATRPISCGVGECFATGEETCIEGGVWESHCIPYFESPEICDGKDNDCDGEIDDGLLVSRYYPDNDKDGFGDSKVIPQEACKQPEGYVKDHTDCNDNDKAINPKADEICDGIDNDCDGYVDEGLTEVYYMDFDKDNFGDNNRPKTACSQPDNYVKNNTDCNDYNPEINPKALEKCDNVDNNCNGDIDDNAPCDAGRICIEGKCVISIPCVSFCEPGQIKCVTEGGQNYYPCTDEDLDGCYEWSSKSELCSMIGTSCCKGGENGVCSTSNCGSSGT